MFPVLVCYFIFAGYFLAWPLATRAPRGRAITPLLRYALRVSHLQVLGGRGALRICVRRFGSGQSRRARKFALELKQTNDGRTRRCTRPPTAPFVPHFASGGG